MADTTGNDPKPTGAKPADAKPEAKSGAVKPPVLDLKARETGASASADKPEPKPADTAATAKPKLAEKPVMPPASRSGFPLVATLGGGVLGLAAAYGLAWFGLWPTTPAPAPAADPRLASFATAIPELETVTQTTQAELATLNQRIGALETAEPAAAAIAAVPVDLSTIEADIAALTQRIESVSAPAADAGIDALRADLAGLGTRLDELAARLGTAEAGLRDLDTTVTETSATLASQPDDIGAVLQLPLILSGFETAFATGRPYETELSALRAAVPTAAIPTTIANQAASGLTRPDIIAGRFAEVLPAMLAGRPVDPTAQWQDGALDWFRSAVALRPTGEIEGENPEAVMSRLEGAVARRDFASAETLLASLPAPMLAAGGDVPALIATQAEAARFLDALRASALSGEAMQ
ncbi:COG4223 family protein [Devosia sp.]|uniref:COG4223 family protein n=1 Tax=Devosia sp. TaxID=1871048 RepID=UPI002FC8807E